LIAFDLQIVRLICLYLTKTRVRSGRNDCGNFKAMFVVCSFFLLAGNHHAGGFADQSVQPASQTPVQAAQRTPEQLQQLAPIALYRIRWMHRFSYNVSIRLSKPIAGCSSTDLKGGPAARELINSLGIKRQGSHRVSLGAATWTKSRGLHLGDACVNNSRM
jgi:hypothetical protein